MQREKLELTEAEGREIVYGDTFDYDIIKDEITDTGRWSVYHDIVIQRKSDGKFFADSYSVGATESQDESPYEYSKPEFKEVFPVERIIITYE